MNPLAELCRILLLSPSPKDCPLVCHLLPTQRVSLKHAIDGRCSGALNSQPIFSLRILLALLENENLNDLLASKTTGLSWPNGLDLIRLMAIQQIHPQLSERILKLVEEQLSKVYPWEIIHRILSLHHGMAGMRVPISVAADILTWPSNLARQAWLTLISPLTSLQLRSLFRMLIVPLNRFEIITPFALWCLHKQVDTDNRKDLYLQSEQDIVIARAILPLVAKNVMECPHPNSPLAAVHSILDAGGLTPRRFPVRAMLPKSIRDTFPNQFWIAQGSLVEHALILSDPLGLGREIVQKEGEQKMDAIVTLAQRISKLGVPLGDIFDAVIQPGLGPWIQHVSPRNRLQWNSSLLIESLYLLGDSEPCKASSPTILRGLLCCILDMEAFNPKQAKIVFDQITASICLRQHAHQDWLRSGWIASFLQRWMQRETRESGNNTSLWAEIFQLIVSFSIHDPSLRSLYPANRGVTNWTPDLENIYMHLYLKAPKKELPWELKKKKKSAWMTRWRRVWTGLLATVRLSKEADGPLALVSLHTFHTFDICDVLDGGLGTVQDDLILNSKIEHETGKSKEEWLNHLVKKSKICHRISLLLGPPSTSESILEIVSTSERQLLQLPQIDR